MKNNNDLMHCVVETSEGFVPLVVSDGMLLELHLPFEDTEMAIEAIGAAHKSIKVYNECKIGDLDRLLIDYFNRIPTDFTGVPIDLTRYSDFAQSVFSELSNISYGSVISYSELAQRCGKPGAARAVGNALGRNRTPIVLPCHRVVTADRKIGGFTAGIEWKHRLLEIEGISL